MRQPLAADTAVHPVPAGVIPGPLEAPLKMFKLTVLNMVNYQNVKAVGVFTQRELAKDTMNARLFAELYGG